MKSHAQEGVSSVLVRYASTADHILDGLLREPGRAKNQGKFKPGIVTLHGSEGSATSGIGIWLAPFLAGNGYVVFSPNKRNSGESYYLSVFDWCKEDIRDAIGFLEDSRGLAEVVLIGHSLGAAEAVFYQGKTRDPIVKALVLLGAPLWPRAVLNPRTLELASRHIKDGRYRIKDERHGTPVSAKHYVSYWGPRSNNDIRKWIGRVDVPILNIAHGIPLNELCNEEASRRIEELAVNSPKVTTAVLPQALHSFVGHLDEATSTVLRWLERLDGP